MVIYVHYIFVILCNNKTIEFLAGIVESHAQSIDIKQVCDLVIFSACNSAVDVYDVEQWAIRIYEWDRFALLDCILIRKKDYVECSSQTGSTTNV